MPYTMEDFRREVALEYMDQLTPEERLGGVTEIIEHMSEDEINALLANLHKRVAEVKSKKSRRRTRRRKST